MKIQNGLKSIVIDFFHSIYHDLLFPSRPLTIEEQLHSKVKDQKAFIRVLDEKISFLYGQIQQRDNKFRDLKQLLVQKDKELEDSRRIIRSLDWQLQVERDANRRKR